jgi:allantoicase
MHNLNLTGRGINMDDGWETARRRSGGNDWVIVALGRPDDISEVEIDTAHFKGIYPESAVIGAALMEGTEDLVVASVNWPVLLPRTKLDAVSVRRYSETLARLGVVSHARMDIFPDGGVSRIRLLGNARK